MTNVKRMKRSGQAPKDYKRNDAKAPPGWAEKEPEMAQVVQEFWLRHKGNVI